MGQVCVFFLAPERATRGFGGGLDFDPRFCHAFTHVIAASDRFRHDFVPCGSMPTGGCRKAIS
jgi:hypothetical protein